MKIRRGHATVFGPCLFEGRQPDPPFETVLTQTGRAIPGGLDDKHISRPVPALPVGAIPLREWLPWAIFTGLILLLAIYFVGAEQGATSLISGWLCA